MEVRGNQYGSKGREETMNDDDETDRKPHHAHLDRFPRSARLFLAATLEKVHRAEAEQDMNVVP